LILPIGSHAVYTATGRGRLICTGRRRLTASIHLLLVYFWAPARPDPIGRCTSTIHFYTNTNGWASDLTSGDYNEAIGMTHPPADLIGGMAYVNSLTPGYQPEIIFQFASGRNGTTNYGNVTGVTIVDKPIAAHT
jgi:hypothetical protein